MQARLVGVHTVKKRLADGTTAVYYYAWRGGPAIKVDRADERKFVEEYVRLTRTRPDAPYADSLAEAVRAYLKSPLYTTLKPSTREGYDLAIKEIEREFFDLPLKALTEKGARRMFLDWRDQIAETHPRKADLYMAVLKRVLGYAVNIELIDRHPLTGIEKVHDETRRDVIWTDSDVSAFKAKAPEPLVRAMMLAAWTGQRQGDLLRLTWSAYDGNAIRLRQSKTASDVSVKVSADLKVILDAAKAHNEKQETPAANILTNERGKPWKTGFKASWRKAVEKHGPKGKTFHDLRGTFVTLAYRNGASIKEIAEVTGHLESDAERIIKKHYLVSSAAVEKIEARTASVNQAK
jgi:integrase